MRTKTTTPKKGNTSWKPAGHLTVFEKKDGLRYRWKEKDPDNLNRALHEGWSYVTKEEGNSAVHDAPGYIDDGKPLTSAIEHRELVLMSMPESVAQERAAYFDEQTARTEQVLKRRAQRELSEGGDAEVHGDITIIR